MSTDAEYGKWGKQDPYLGVITFEKYRNQNLSGSAKQAFADNWGWPFLNESGFWEEVCKPLNQYLEILLRSLNVWSKELLEKPTGLQKTLKCK